MATFRRARGDCPACGRESGARVSDKSKSVDLACAGCGRTFTLPVSSTWWITWTDALGKPRVKRVGPDWRLAKQLEAKRKTDVIKKAEGIGTRRGSGLTLGEALRLYQEAHAHQVKPGPFKRRMGCLSRTVGRLGASVQIGKLDEPTIEALRRKRATAGRKPGTVALELARFKAFLSWCVREKLLTTRPPIKVGHVDNGRLRYLSRPEADRLLAEAGKVDGTVQDLLELLLFTGLRRCEGIFLRWEWVDLGRRALDLPGEACKSGHGRTVPLAGPVVAMLERRRREAEEPIRPLVFPLGGLDPVRRAEKLFWKARDAAELGRDVTLHVLRHTCASWLAMAGVDLFTVGQILGHRNPIVTMRYAHLAPGHLLTAIDRLAPQDPEPVPIPAENPQAIRDQGITGGNVVAFPLARTGR
jgi:integrase